MHGQGGTPRDLLFGLVALQNGLVSPEALVSAFQVWTRERGRSMAEILLGQGALDADGRAAIETLVAKHLGRYVEETEKGLVPPTAAGPTGVPPDGPGGPEFQATLLRALPGDDGGRRPRPDGTLSYSAGVPTDPGQRFRILRPHAKGGLGAVFVALDGELNREVALKQIHDRHADDPQSRARFLIEAEITGGLEHPGVVPVYGLGTYDEGRPYYAMRFVKGSTLRQEIEAFHKRWSGTDVGGGGRWGLELRHLLGRFIAVCDTIHYAHSRGVVHRDIKPANILLGPYGETLVVDWGLAKQVGRPDADAARAGPDLSSEATLRPSLRSGSSETVPGLAIGTPAYMSPEQAEGRLDRIGPASDVYSLGATLYALLTGRPRFDDDDLPDLFARVRAGDFPRPRQVNPRVPGALEVVCMRALELDPKGRYPSPRALADDLEHWLADEPVPGHREPFSTRATRWGRRHRTAAVAIGVVLVSAVAALALSTTLVGREQAETERQRRIALENFDDAKRQGALVSEKARSLERQLYINRINLAAREAQGEVARAEAYLELCPALRGWEWDFLKRNCHLERQTFGGHADTVDAVAFSPDGTRFVTAAGKQNYDARRDDEPDLFLWDARTGERVRRFTGLHGDIKDVAFSPDGTRLAVAGGYHEPAAGLLTVFDTADGRATFQKTIESLNVRSVAFSPDGKTLAVGLGKHDTHVPGRLTLWEVPGGKKLVDLPASDGGGGAVAFSPDGKTLALACSDRIELYDVGPTAGGGAARRRDLVGHSDFIYTLAFSPDGTRLASGGWDTTIRIWDVAAGKMVESIGNDSFVRSLAYSPDGTRLASTRDATVVLWDPSTGRLESQLRGHLRPVQAVAFSPDGRRLLSGAEDRTAKLWDVDAQSPRVVRAHQGWVTRFSFTPDGTRLATASGDHSVAIWDPATWRRLATVPVPEWVLGVALSPDGGLLAAASADGHLRVWRTPSLDLIHDLHAGLNPPQAVVFTPDGTRMVVGTGSIRSVNDQKGVGLVIDARTGETLRTFEGHKGGIFGLALSPDGRAVASAGGDPRLQTAEAKLWDLETGREVRTFEGHTDVVRDVAFSRDGRLLATGGEDRTVRVWDLAGGEASRRIEVGNHRVFCLDFSRDGTRVATGDTAGAVKLFNTATGDEIINLPGTSFYTTSLKFSPDGLSLLSGGVDRVIRVWEAGPRAAAGRD